MGFVKIIDESSSGQELSTRRLEISSASVTLRELIRRRIYEEVGEFNRQQTDVFFGLIQPTETERVLNGYRLKAHRQINPENQYARALEAFAGNGFFVIIDGRQVEDIDEIISLKESSEVHFLKLVPLVGG